ncbi:hypothetical protein L202_06067 [Cryptococcus amylolentus CBS 6039]|uniref:GIT Spa2 homology (SHD) domain-containing protein n=1 Tax=Cryptococcus amylolentus CBS 6039 TaxID=1295533 RepID=A0A1E3HIF9_9TREE|nr:hypothetical protein L202_06067 [Cryptococcus amylolentus CBS 6039]ODN76142.1 hypothetical protein L202_06067 [Cryptococcus amylolentus CBS 6039]
MSMAASRSFANPSYPSSPGPATASSLGYSQYGSGSFAGGGPSRQLSISSSAYGPSAGPPSRSGSGNGVIKASEKRGESREVARVHWKALKEFLASWIARESPTARASAREKLTRLTKLQFQELSTDVYDELMRRIASETGEGATAPFLPVREDFHPKRNQARQKLATLPSNRFKDLASDVFYELKRRFPEFEREQGQLQQYEEPPAPGPRPSMSQSHSQQSLSYSSQRGIAETPPPTLIARNASSNSLSNSLHQRQGSRQMSASTHRSRPSNDRNNPREPEPEPEEEFLDDNGYDDRRPQANAATNDIVVPSKSRLREEEIEVPYARDSTMDVFRQSVASRGESGRGSGYGRDSQASYGMSPSASFTGEDFRRNAPRNAELLPEREYVSDTQITSKSLRNEEAERKLRDEYEYRLETLDKKVAAAERERDEARRAEVQERDMRLELEDQIKKLKEQTSTHSSSLRALQHDLDLARDKTESARQRAEQANANADEEVAQWRERSEQLEDECRRLEEEKVSLEDELARSGQGQAVGNIRDELQSLVDELNSLSMRNEDLLTERESDAMRLSDMEAKVSEYKRKYDAVRVELRNLKATSTMFATFSKPITDDHLPASPDGNILDINVSAFQSSVDNLLSAARSSSPSGVLPAMKAIVEAITAIGEDVKGFEANPNIDVDVSRLESLKYESTTRLNNLMQAARNHAMASGLSPVSLLDAAAGHLSTNVVEIIKLLKIKRSDKDLKRSSSRLSIRDMVNRDRERDRANETWDANYRSESRSGRRAEASDERGPGVKVTRPSVDRSQSGRAPSRSGSASGIRYEPSRAVTPTEAVPTTLNSSGPPSSYRSPPSSSSYNNPTSASPSLSNASPPPAPLRAQNDQGRPNLRINSYQSVSSNARSDSFDLERKSSILTERSPSARVEPRNAPTPMEMTRENDARERESLGSTGTASSSGGPMTAPGSARPFGSVEVKQAESDDDGREWEDLKPYLNAQSSALVNSIQNLLAAIRTNSSPAALNEHLSEVIAIASSIVAVSTNALPGSLRGQGDGLLKELVSNTDKLSEAQEAGQQDGQAGVFEKAARQQIASASFGVAKSLKALMKLGTNGD